MIDFRYHLVSLVSVFIALAIGVVLGAGPLGGALGDTLNNQIVGLRQDKTALQQAVTNRDNKIQAQDAALGAVSTSVVEGRLTGHSAVIVLLPDASGTQADEVRALLDQAGAVTTARVEIQPAWLDPAAQRRASQTPEGGADVLSTALAQSLTAKTSGGAAPEPDTALTTLTDSGLVTLTRNQPVTADLVVLVGPGGADLTEEESAAREEAQLALVRAFQTSAGRVVVAAPSDSDKGVVGQVLAADIASSVSTVDSLQEASGPLATVLILAQPQDTAPAHYGTGTAATSLLPAVPARPEQTDAATEQPPAEQPEPTDQQTP